MRYLPLLCLIAVTACSTHSTPDMVYTKMDVAQPTTQSFPYCHGYGCRLVEDLSLNDGQIKKIKRIFKTNRTATQERDNIATATAYLETITGEKAGTSTDVAGTYVQLGNDQLDCIDESTNTTTYLVLLNQLSLMQFHTPNALTSRAPILSGRLGPHRTAVMTEVTTGTKFAVDSWFHDNGQPPEIVELSTWRWGWHPPKSAID